MEAAPANPSAAPDAANPSAAPETELDTPNPNAAPDAAANPSAAPDTDPDPAPNPNTAPDIAAAGDAVPDPSSNSSAPHDTTPNPSAAPDTDPDAAPTPNADPLDATSNTNAEPDAAAPDPNPEEKRIAAVAACLCALKPAQRPVTADSLENWLLRRCSRVVRRVRATAKALAKELQSCGLVCGSDRLTYNENLLATLVGPAAKVAPEAKSALETGTVSLGKGLLGKANVAKLVKHGLKKAASRWGAARVAVGCNSTTKRFEVKFWAEAGRSSDVQKAVSAELYKPSFEVNNLFIDGGFFGVGGNSLKKLEKNLHCALAVNKTKGVVCVTRLAETTLSNEAIVLVLRNTAGTPPPIRLEGLFKSQETGCIIGKRGRKLLMMQMSTNTRLNVSGTTVQGWLSSGAIFTGSDISKEALAGAVNEAKEAVTRFIITTLANFVPPGQGQEDTFADEFANMKSERDYERTVAMAKKAARQPPRSERSQRAAAQEILGLRDALLSELRNLHVCEGHTPASELREQRLNMEDSMREIVRMAAEELRPAAQFRPGLEPALTELAALLDVERSREDTAEQLMHRLLGSRVWQRLGKAKSQYKGKQELLVHVRKGKPTRPRAEERGGRFKPGEAAAEGGRTAESSLGCFQPPARVGEEEETEEAHAGEEDEAA